MKKSLLSLMMASAAIVASAQSWNFSEWEAGTYSADLTDGALTITASADNPVTIDGNKKTVDGIEYTQRLKTGGGGKEDGRVLCIALEGNTTIHFVSCSSNSSDERTINVAYGAWDQVADTFTAPTSVAVQTVEYTGGEPTTAYFYSANGGWNIYAIYCESSATPEGSYFDVENVTNMFNEAGSEIDQLLYQFQVTLPEGYEINYDVTPVLYHGDEVINGSYMPIDDITVGARFMNQQFYTDPGEYCLVLPDGSFKLGPQLSNEWKGIWTVVAPAPAFELGYPAFNIDDEPFYGYAQWADMEVMGLYITFPEADEMTPDMTIEVQAVLKTAAPAEGEEDDVDPGFGMPELVECTEITTFTGDAWFGEPVVNLTDFLIYIYETGKSALYGIDVKNIRVVDGNGETIYGWYANGDEPAIGTVFYVEFPEDPSSISNIAAEKSATIYNLQGQRVNAAKGMVIKNGKKAYVK